MLTHVNLIAQIEQVSTTFVPPVVLGLTQHP